MRDEERKCPNKWDQSQFLAYMEGDMDKSAREALEAHLKNCEICSSELESFRKMDVLLRDHPDVFHPDEQELYLFVTQNEDPGGEIEHHLETCESCQEDVALLKEMIDARHKATTEIPAVPQRLLREIGQSQRSAAREGVLERVYISVADLISTLFRMPRLALGTAAAIVVLVIISVPLLKHYKDVPSPDSSLVQEPRLQKPSDSILSEAYQSRQDFEKDKSVETQEKLRSELQGRPEAPSSPPAMRFAPERKREKFDYRDSLRSSPTTEAAPAEISPKVSTKQKSRSAADGPAALNEKEASSSPKASKQPMAISPTQKEPAKRHSLAPVEQTRRQFGARPSLYDSLIPVRIQIVDSQGRIIPDFKFQLPADLVNRYRLEEATGDGAADLVVVRVTKQDGSFDLSADLVKSGSTGSNRALQAHDVPVRDLQDNITSLVTSLLEGN